MAVSGAAQPAAVPGGEASGTPDEPASDEATDILEAPEDPVAPEGEYSDGGEYPDQEYWEEGDNERPPLSKLAVVALVTGLLALLPLALGFGIAALAVIRRTGRRGYGIALAGIYAAWIWVLIGAAAAGLVYYTHGFSPRVQVRYQESAAYSLQPGDCLNLLNDGSYSLVSCSTSHDAEVYGRFRLTGSKYPGDAAIQSTVTSGCATLLSAYINPQYADIGFSQEYVYPDQTAWTAGERTVVCEASFDSGAISGSIRKS